MIYILSFLGIIIENSLPVNYSIMVVTLPFFIYLVNLKRIRSVSCIFLMSVVIALQTQNFVEQFVLMALFYYLFNFIFVNFVYSRDNLFSISLLQLGMYFIFNYKNYNKYSLGLNFIGFIILNYFYIRHMRKKNSARGNNYEEKK